MNMHMSDALLSPVVGGLMWGGSAGALGYAGAKIKREALGEKTLPVMAVSGAFVFAAQMINFSIPATGSSGHIGGGILLAGLLGPFPSLLATAAVLIIQALFFADGGLIALGCNIFNMGVIPCLLVYPLLFRLPLKRGFTLPRLTAASILSVVAALQIGAFGVVLETLASGITALPFGTFALLMQPIHLAIGLVEGLVTAAVLGFVYKMRPEILECAKNAGPLPKAVSTKKVIAALAAAAVVTGGLLSLFASSYPDGLEWAIEKTAGGAELEAEGPVFQSAEALQTATAFMPDYDFAGAPEEGSGMGTSVAGLAGAGLTAALAAATGLTIRAVKRKRAGKSTPS